MAERASANFCYNANCMRAKFLILSFIFNGIETRFVQSRSTGFPSSQRVLMGTVMATDHLAEMVRRYAEALPTC
jgi:hypothetical protein